MQSLHNHVVFTHGRWALLAAATLSFVLPAFARAATTTSPTTRPAGSDPSPALRDRLLVFPFDVLAGRSGGAWLGRSMQQSLLTDLITKGTFPAGPGVGTPADMREAAAAARTARSRYALVGTIHVLEGPGRNTLRVTAQLVDASTEHPIGALKATGSDDNLFAIEDDLSAQLGRALDTTARSAVPATPPQEYPSPVEEIPPTGPLRMGRDHQTGPSPVFVPVPPAPPPAAYYRYHFGPDYLLYGTTYGSTGYGFSNIYYRPAFPYYGSYYGPRYYSPGYSGLQIGPIIYRGGNSRVVFRGRF